jgi:hypothetical protein
MVPKIWRLVSPVTTTVTPELVQISTTTYFTKIDCMVGASFLREINTDFFEVD